MQQKKHDPAVLHTRSLFDSKTNKFGKHAFALTVLSAALWSAGAAAQYVEPGQLGNVASWETPEYLRSWGVGAMKASSAYAEGFNGSGAKVGVMDSGALSTHQEFDDPARFTYVAQNGAYGTTGMRYRGAGYAPTSLDPATASGGAFTVGQIFAITGAYDSTINDNHGTSVTGIVGANRDGTEMHGIAWGANIIVGNTGATDNNNYGPYQDYDFFYTGWKAMVDAGAQIINNSWGTNIRINLGGQGTPPNDYPQTTPPGVANNSVYGPDGGPVGNMLPTDTLAQVEYEYFYFKKMYGSGRSFVDAAWDAIKTTSNKVVQIMTTGNRDMVNPFQRALYPYFHPEAEAQWVAVAGIKPHDTDAGHLILQAQYNEAGLAKWWTVVGPTLSGSGVNAGMTMWTTRLDTSPFPANGAYAGFSGTSCSAPHIAGAMGVLLSRYPHMTSSQVRDVMFTTATNKNTDNSTFALWNPATPAGVPDERYGWGLPDLDKGMKGPAQFLGRFEYDLPSGKEDTWKNDISQVAALARKAEDQAWLASYDPSNVDALGPYSLGDAFIVADNDVSPSNTSYVIDLADAKTWRKEYADARKAAIEAKLVFDTSTGTDLYDASLVKKGAGKLVMSGTNTFAGLTAAGGVTELDGNNNLTANTVIQSGGTIQVNKEAATTPPKNGVLISPLVDIRADGTLTGNGDICDSAGVIPCSVTNAGTITPSGSATHSSPSDINTLTIHGNYTGSSGGRIVLNGVFNGDSTVLDKVVIGGTASGTTTVVLNALPGSTGALTTGTPVVGVEINGGSGTFQTAPLTINGVTYTVIQQGNNLVLQGLKASNTASIPTVSGGMLGAIGVLLAGMATLVLRRRNVRS